MSSSHQSNQTAKIRSVFFFVLLGLAFVLAFFIFSPFLSPLVVAAMFAVVLEPVFIFFNNRMHAPRILASILTVLTLLIVIGLPVTIIGKALLGQSQEVYQTLHQGDLTALFSPELKTSIDTVVPGGIESFVPSVDALTQKITENIGAVFKGTLQTIFAVVLSLLALFYFLKDGEHFKQRLIALSPLSDKYDKLIVSRLKSAINSVIRGSLTIALIQGILAGIGMALFGIPHAVLWGALTLLVALIPSIGTSLVLVPAVLYLFVIGMPLHAVGLLVWSLMIVGLIDNVLNPILVGRGINIHPFFILLSVLGGLSFFGPVGFILGPMIVSFLFTLLDLYRLDFEEKVQ